MSNATIPSETKETASSKPAEKLPPTAEQAKAASAKAASAKAAQRIKDEADAIVDGFNSYLANLLAKSSNAATVEIAKRYGASGNKLGRPTDATLFFTLILSMNAKKLSEDQKVELARTAKRAHSEAMAKETKFRPIVDMKAKATDGGEGKSSYKFNPPAWVDVS